MSTRIHPGPLERLPCSAGLPADAAAGMDVAERLGLWLSAFDAIGLRAALESLQAGARPRGRARAPAPRGPHATAPALADALQRVRGAALAAIARPLDEDLGRADDGTPAFTPWRQRHLELQRLMEPMVAGLREDARRALAADPAPMLQRLAALDAALAPVVAAREQALWPTLVGLMERRFGGLRADGGTDWMAAFRREWRQALQVELDLRLAPVTGLAEAFDNASHKG